MNLGVFSKRRIRVHTTSSNNTTETIQRSHKDNTKQLKNLCREIQQLNKQEKNIKEKSYSTIKKHTESQLIPTQQIANVLHEMGAFPYLKLNKGISNKTDTFQIPIPTAQLNTEPIYKRYFCKSTVTTFQLPWKLVESSDESVLDNSIYLTEKHLKHLYILPRDKFQASRQRTDEVILDYEKENEELNDKLYEATDTTKRTYALLHTTIGIGGFGKVVVAYHLQKREVVAAKISRDETQSSYENTQSLFNEFQLLKKIGEPVDFMFFKTQHKQHFGILITPLMGMNLKQFVDTSSEATNNLIFTYFQDITKGLMHIHTHGIIHRDIKPENILISQDLSFAKICDLGVSIEADRHILKEFAGTPRYAALEVLRDLEYSTHSDIFGLGSVFYRIMFFNREKEDLYQEISTSTISTDDSPIYKDLVNIAKKIGNRFSINKSILKSDNLTFFLDSLIRSQPLAQFSNPKNDFQKQNTLADTPSLFNILLGCFHEKPKDRISLNTILSQLNQTS